MIEIKADYAGAQKKTAVLRRVPAAFFRNTDDWAGATIHYIKRSYQGGRVFKRPPKEFDDRLAKIVVKTGPTSATIVIGTGGYVGLKEVKYARIQEEGGWVVATKRMLTIPFPGVHGPANSYRGRSFVLKTGPDRGIIAMKTGKSGRIVPLFALRKSVKLPARYWFTRPIAERMPKLEQMTSEAGVWATASMMAYRAEGGKI